MSPSIYCSLHIPDPTSSQLPAWLSTFAFPSCAPDWRYRSFIYLHLRRRCPHLCIDHSLNLRNLALQLSSAWAISQALILHYLVTGRRNRKHHSHLHLRHLHHLLRIFLHLPWSHDLFSYPTCAEKPCFPKIRVSGPTITSLPKAIYTSATKIPPSPLLSRPTPMLSHVLPLQLLNQFIQLAHFDVRSLGIQHSFKHP